MERKVIVRSPEDGERLGVMGDLYRVLARGDETAGRYAMVHAQIPPGGGPPPHLHRQDEEAFYILAGTLTMFVRGEPVQAAPGTFVSIPAGTPHNFQNQGEAPVEALILVAPAGLEAMFAEIGQRLEPGQLPGPPGEADVARLLAAVSRYGVDLL